MRIVNGQIAVSLWKPSLFLQLAALLACLVFSPSSSADTVDYTWDSSIGRGESQTFSYSGQYSANPLTRSEKVNIPILNLPGRSGLDLDISLSYTNNFWTLGNGDLVSLFGVAGSNEGGAGGTPYQDGAEDILTFLRPSFSSDSFTASHPDFGTPPYTPPNNLGGWSVVSPAGARIYMHGDILNDCSDTTGGECAYYNYSTSSWVMAPPGQVVRYFTYVAPDGSVKNYFPTFDVPMPANGMPASAIWAEPNIYAPSTQDMGAYLRQLPREYDSADGDGSKLVITDQTAAYLVPPAGSIFAGTNYSGPVVRVIHTDGRFEEFALGETTDANIDPEDDDDFYDVILASGIPTKVGDRFGNFISIAFNFIPAVNFGAYVNTWAVASATLTDTVGRQVVLNYDPQLQFPSQIVAKSAGPDGSDLTTSIQFQDLYYNNSELQGCISAETSNWNLYQTIFTPNGQDQLFYTVAAVTLPNSNRWTFNYDRGWGNTVLKGQANGVVFNNQAVLQSDGSIVSATSPTGLQTQFATGKLSYQTLDQLTGLAFGPLDCVRYGYVNQITTIDRTGAPLGAVAFSTSLTIGGGGLVNTEVTQAAFKDANGALLKTEVSTFANWWTTDPSVTFAGSNYKASTVSVTGLDYPLLRKDIYDASSALARSSSYTYDCYQPMGNTDYASSLGAAMIPGYCLPVTTTVVQDGVTTSKSYSYETGVSRTLWFPVELTGPYNQPYDATVPEDGSFFRVSGLSEFDGPTLVRETSTTYSNDPSLVSANLLGLPVSETVTDGSGSPVSSEAYVYDGQAATAVASLPNFSGGAAIGLRTQSTRHDPLGQLPDIVTHVAYNQAGQAVIRTNARGFTTTVQYDPVAGCGGSYPTSSTNPLGQTTQMTYLCGSGVSAAAEVASTTDANGLTTTYQYADPLLRLTQINTPDGRTETHAYDDVGLTETEDSFGPGQPPVQTTTQFDGRHQSVQVTSTDPNGISTVSRGTAYDFLGRIVRETNVYGKATTKSYDALGRETSTVFPDGSASSQSYRGRTVSSVDFYGRTKSILRDYFGNTIQVAAEDGKITQYSYNSLNKLLLAQLPDGAPPRTFTYDGFGRKLTSQLPEESGSESISAYDADGNPTQITTSQGYQLTLTYDALDRLTDKVFSGGPVSTPPLHYTFDTAANGIGKLAAVSDGSISRALAYDGVGRLSGETLTVGSNVPYSLGYAYSPDGNLQSVRLPSGRTATYAYNGANNIQSVSWNGNAGSSSSYTIDQYASHGAVEQSHLGNGLVTTSAYDPNTFYLTSRSTPGALSISYDYTSEPSPCNPSQAFNSAEGSFLGSVTESVGRLGTRTIDFQYDCLGRLAQATASGSEQWSLQYAFDANFNRVSQSGVAPINQSFGFDSSNHVAGYSYDTGGNITNDGKTSYVYDGAHRLVSSTTGGVVTQYQYLGEQRIVKVSGGVETDYVRANSGALYSEFESGTGPASSLGGAVGYYHRDHLSSVRAVTDFSGNLVSTHQYYPYGEEETPVATDGISVKFSGHERDPESGNDFMNARYYGSSAGIFLAIDQGEPDLANPQSWNRYAYADNNPVNKVDPSGNISLWAGIKLVANDFSQSMIGDAKQELNSVVVPAAQLMNMMAVKSFGAQDRIAIEPLKMSNAIQAREAESTAHADIIPNPGSSITLVKRLTGGSMGGAWLALKDGQQVVFKAARSGNQFTLHNIAELTESTQTLQKYGGPKFLGVYEDVGVNHKTGVLMEYIEGKNLSEVKMTDKMKESYQGYYEQLERDGMSPRDDHKDNFIVTPDEQVRPIDQWVVDKQNPRAPGQPLAPTQ